MSTGRVKWDDLTLKRNILFQKIATENLSISVYNTKQKKDKLQSMSFISAVNIDGMPHGTNISNPTAMQGEVIAQLKHDIEIIERTAMETDAEFYEYILENVTKGISWEYLDVPLSRRSFYYLRRKYFYLLSKKI